MYADEHALNTFLRSCIWDLPIGQKYVQYFLIGLFYIWLYICM